MGPRLRNRSNGVSDDRVLLVVVYVVGLTCGLFVGMGDLALGFVAAVVGSVLLLLEVRR
jgi:hypothetical protein